MATCGTGKPEMSKEVEAAFKRAGFDIENLGKYVNPSMDATDFGDGKPVVGLKYKKPDPDTTLHDPLTVAITSANEYLADIIALTNNGKPGNEMAVHAAEKGAGLVKESAEWADAHIRENKYVGEIYADTLDLMTGVWNNHEQLQVIKYYASAGGKWKEQFNKIASIRHAAQQDQIQILQKAEAGLSKDYNNRYKTTKERENGYQILANSAIFGIVRNGVLGRITNNKEKVVDLIKEFEGRLTGSKSETMLQTARDLSDLYSDVDLTGRRVLSNLEAYGYTQNSDVYNDLQALITLYSLEHATKPEEFLTDMAHNDPELFEGFIGLTLASKSISDRLARQSHKNGLETNSQKGNLLEDVGPINYHLQSVSFKQLVKDPHMGEENGWEVLRKPKKDGSLGIIRREHTSVVQQGIAGNASYIKSGVPISVGAVNEDAETTGINREEIDMLIANNSLFIKDNSLGGTNPSLTLTAEEKKTLKYEKDPVMALTRAYAHNNMLMETQIARDQITSIFTKRFKDPDKMEADIIPLIKDGEHPPLIKVSDDFIYDDLTQEIKDKYKLVDTTVLSNVGGFKNNANLVRKDMGEYVLGYGKGSIFGDNHKASIAHKRAKDLIRLFKINNIVLNAPKIVADMSAGIAVATAKGASIQEVITYSKEAYAGVKRVADIRDRKADLLFKRAQKKEGTTAYDNLTKAINKINKELEADDFSAAYANGFIQSLGSQLILEDMTSPQGLQATMEDTIRKFMVKDGKPTQLNESIKKAVNLGGEVGLEGLYYMAGDAVKNRLKGESEGAAIKRFGERLNRLKSKEDMSELVAEAMGAPSSSLVQAGGAMTQLADLIPRWVIYKHNINAGMTEQDAVTDALDSLLDYKVALPSSLQFLSDLYLLPYPSFFVRIQRVIWALGTKSPASLAAQLSLENYLQQQFGISGSNIVDSDIISKVLDGRLTSNPTDLITFPYANMFGF